MVFIDLWVVKLIVISVDGVICDVNVVDVVFFLLVIFGVLYYEISDLWMLLIFDELCVD